MCEEPPAAKLPPPPPESEALQCGVVEVPPGATRVSEVEAARHPAEPDRAIAIVSELRSNAALFAAFAFGALSLPTTLVISESRVTSTTSSLSTSRPVPDSDLLSAFVFLDVATLSCMLVCVVVSQQLIYRLSDGSYEAIRYGCVDGAEQDPRDSAVGRLYTQYGAYFVVARDAFGFGVVSLLCATVVKTWAIFDQSIALPVSGIIALAAAAIVAFYVRANEDVFRRLDPSAGASSLATPVG